MTVDSEFAVVGVLMRVEQSLRTSVEQALTEIEGVTTFPVGDPLKLGGVVEASTIAAAQELVERRLETTPGVLGVWPVFAHEEVEQDELPQLVPSLACTAHGARSETT